MATSAFKSTSRRGGSESSTSSSSVKKGPPPIRRSRSVAKLDFVKKRDNPLFRRSCESAEEEGERRGRSVVTRRRNHFINNNNEEPAAAAYRRPSARIEENRRSVSSVLVSETEADKESVVSFNHERKSCWNATGNNLKEANSGGEEVDMQTQATEHHGIGSLNNNFASNSQTPNMKDWDSTSSCLGAEQKTMMAIGEKIEGNQITGGETATGGIYETVRSEVRRAILDIQTDLGSVILKNNAAAITVTNVANIPQDLVNPGTLGHVLEIRREYATKLEECQERARKLRADLLVEEHRGQELTRVLKELLLDPKKNILQKTRPQKKNSSERKKMTKRLTEEALAYFDECVSISTFDSSDFSAAEDQPLILNGATVPVGRSPFSVQGSPSVSGSCCPNSYLDHKQGSGGLLIHSQTSSSLAACCSSSDEPLIDKASLKGSNINRGGKLQFSFSSEPTKNFGLQEDIKSYTKQIEKSFSKDKKSPAGIRTGCNDIAEYQLRRSESMLYDRIICKNRTDFGTLHLCDGGGLGISVSALGPVI